MTEYRWPTLMGSLCTYWGVKSVPSASTTASVWLSMENQKFPNALMDKWLALWYQRQNQDPILTWC